jgi:hypothetical protein
MTPQKPSIGRIVHYICGDGRHLPCTVTEVYQNVRFLSFVVHGLSHAAPAALMYSIEQGDTLGTWHWPERD